MSTSSAIEWTDATWNPVVGCKMVSPGCANCYAETMANRLAHMAIHDDAKMGAKATRKDHYLKVMNLETGRWKGNVVCVPEALTDPFGWRRPRRVFVNSMSDLFHEDVPFDFIDRVFAVMALCPQHTFQILTKRPERMAEYLAGLDVDGDDIGGQDAGHRLGAAAGQLLDGKWVWEDGKRHRPAIERFISDTHNEPYLDPDESLDLDDSASGDPSPVPWPIPGVWLGTSVENQKCADERIPHLLKCLAAVRFLSCEPLLEIVDLVAHVQRRGLHYKTITGTGWMGPDEPKIHWVIAGGESGPGARECRASWIESLVTQCECAGVPIFVKQMGSQFVSDRDFSDVSHEVKLKSKKGGDMAEFPADLQIRQMPTPERTVQHAT